MSLGTLVQMKGDPHGTIGVIIEVIDDKAVSTETITRFCGYARYVTHHTQTKMGW